ncbi:helix-turn-helix transcriptional regulator [bacterium]|nr:helix-turn-helix transcriptional regulator [bacterium]
MKDLTKIEETVILAIWRLGEKAYGVEVRREVERATEKSVNYSTLYATLEQMVRKGLICKQFGEPTAVRGGKRKVFFKPAPEGLGALKEAFERQKNVWAGVNDESFKRGCI